MIYMLLLPPHYFHNSTVDVLTPCNCQHNNPFLHLKKQNIKNTINFDSFTDKIHSI